LSVGVFADVDTHTPNKRFRNICKSLTALNRTAVTEGVPGFPINIPEEISSLTTGSPRVGIFLFPDNIRPGALETILLECSNANFPELMERTHDFVNGIEKDIPSSYLPLKRFRAGMGTSKATAGIIANLLSPGTSLAVSLFKSDWLNDGAFDIDSVKGVDLFLESMLTEHQA
jgi:hypothetical protein